MLVLRNVVAVLALAVLPACTAGYQRNRPNATRVNRLDPVSFAVTNDRLSEVKVYLLRGSERTRLGTVLQGQTTRFTVPSNLLLTGLEVRLAVEPTDGSSGYMTEQIAAWPGDRVTFKFEENGAFRTYEGPPKRLRP